MEEVKPIEILRLWTSTGHDFKGRHGLGRMEHGVAEQKIIECHAGKGVVGDRFYDYKPDFKGQITFFDDSVADELQQSLNVADLDPSAFRRNVLVRGVDLNELIGKTFYLDGIGFAGSEECSPCYWMDEAVAPGAFEWLKGRGGLRCRILTSGQLSIGSSMLNISHE
ncbi:MAG: MOSC domain-containing protein [Verrucomicrobiota bacterium]